MGEVPEVCGDLLTCVTASRVRTRDRLRAWVHLAVLGVHDPSRSWRSLTVGRASKGKGLVSQLAVLRPEAEGGAPSAVRALAVLVDIAERARCDLVPFFPDTSLALVEGGLGAARSCWESPYGECEDTWAVAAGAPPDLDSLLVLPRRPGEPGTDDRSRLHRWAALVWGAFAETIDCTVTPYSPKQVQALKAER